MTEWKMDGPHLNEPPFSFEPLIRYLFGRLGRGRAGRVNSEKGRGLFERSEFRSLGIRRSGAGDPQGRARARMVFGPFAETKGPRLAGRNPAYKKREVWIPAPRFREDKLHGNGKLKYPGFTSSWE